MALFQEYPPQFTGPSTGPVGQIMPVQQPGPIQGGMMPQFYAGQDPLPQMNTYAPLIDGEISERLLGTDPFPEELIPPFRVRPGDNGGGALDVGNGGWRPAAVNLGQFDPVTREVQQEELTSYQLEQLLDGDSAYMENARRRGEEQAASRGALNSSMFAGASQRAAIEAGAPIAQADAGAYIQAASENLAAVNNNILAKMNAAVSMATTNSQVSGTLAANRLANDSGERIAEAQMNAEYVMQQARFVQDQFLQNMDQMGKERLLGQGFGYDSQLQGQQFGYEAFLNNLDHDQALELEELYGQPRFEADMQFRYTSSYAQLASNAISNYASMIQSMNGLELDDAARQRGYGFAQDFLQSALSVGQIFQDTGNWPDFNFNFGP